jgi:hypothetical protein
MTMKLPQAFLDRLEQADQPQTENYLRYGKLESGASANFSLLEKDPFCYYLVWAVAKDGGAKKPFRFLNEPTDQDIELELGREYSRDLNYEKTGVRKPDLCFTWPVYNWDLKQVQVLEVTHASLRNQFAKFGLNKKYKNLLAWDFELTKVVTDRTRYDLMIVPRDEDEHEEEGMDAAWEEVQKAGFDLHELLRNESKADPFKPGN